MTGLDLSKDVIIQIACFITDYNLNLLEPSGYEAVIHQSKKTMDRMGEWCTKTHGDSGLTAAVLASSTSPEKAAHDLLSYIKQHIPQPRKALLAGNSVHADQAFLQKPPYDQVLTHLHYRILDVSAIKEAARRWAPVEVLEKAPRKKGLHEAKEDILESIAEAKFYQDAFFKK
jgi:oligoribonuclease